MKTFASIISIRNTDKLRNFHKPCDRPLKNVNKNHSDKKSLNNIDDAKIFTESLIDFQHSTQ